MWADAMAEIRGAFEPRRLIAWGRWAVSPPPWCDPGDDLHGTYAHQERLFRRGQVVWACFIQANARLYRPGDGDSPAAAVYGLAPDLDAAAEVLHGVAVRVHALKGTAPDDPDVRRIADLITDERARGLDTPLPPSLTRDRDLLTTTVMIHREHLPAGYVTGRKLLFPLLIDPETHASLVLPAEYWSAPVLTLWSEASGSPR